MVVASGTNSFAKEMAIRKRISNIYNKREEDFPSLREYNDYLEEVEDMTCKLIEDFDVPAIEAKTTKYEQENYDQIMNAACKAEELAQHWQQARDLLHRQTVSWPQVKAHKPVFPVYPRGNMHLQLQEVHLPSHDQQA
ncbi:hypothetical protein Ancab_027663 [Ancistrocladus abbreviatus]